MGKEREGRGNERGEGESGGVSKPEPGSPFWSNLFLRLGLRGGELLWRVRWLGGGVGGDGGGEVKVSEEGESEPGGNR